MQRLCSHNIWRRTIQQPNGSSADDGRKGWSLNRKGWSLFCSAYETCICACNSAPGTDPSMLRQPPPLMGRPRTQALGSADEARVLQKLESADEDERVRSQAAEQTRLTMQFDHLCGQVQNFRFCMPTSVDGYRTVQNSQQDSD